jgi:hypothetical protein
MQQDIGTSQLKFTCTLDAARYPDPGDTYDGVRLLSSWTCRLNVYNLTPSLQLNDQKAKNGDYSKSLEIRMTLDRKLYSDLPRSSIALFYRVCDELDDVEQTMVTTFGVLPSLYIKIGANSTLTLVYDYSGWTRESDTDKDGVDKTINLTWKLVF